MADDKDKAPQPEENDNDAAGRAAEGKDITLDETGTAQRKRDIGSAIILFILAGLAFAMPHLMYGGPSYEHMLLVATDKLDADENFSDTVIYLTQHGMGGAKGLIINRPDEFMPYDEVYDMLGVRYKNTDGGLHSWFGGPVKTDKFTFFHTDDERTKKSEQEGPGLMITHESMAMVQKISSGDGPEESRFLWGYSGWAPEQLETELEQGKWYIIKADNDLIFHEPADEIYALALQRYEEQKSAAENAQDKDPAAPPTQ